MTGLVNAIVLMLAGIAAQQGEAIRLTLPDEPGIQRVEVRWQDKTIPYVRAGNEWSTILGIDLDLKPGDHTGEVRVTKAGVVERRSVTLSVTAGNFPTQRLTVPDTYVELSPENGERAAREAKEIESIHNTISAEALWSASFVVPIPGGVGSNFGNRRVFNGESRNPHSGADLRAATGTRIRSTNRGRVVLAKNLFFTGNTVIVDHGLGIYTLYAHLSRIDVKKDAMVERAQVVGLAGATGRVTGPHLHWGARVQNARVDPFSLINMKTGK
jgi:murein DD-endopeptidase MepM/ murein hydrolase activator NlpD